MSRSMPRHISHLSPLSPSLSLQTCCKMHWLLWCLGARVPDQSVIVWPRLMIQHVTINASTHITSLSSLSVPFFANLEQSALIIVVPWREGARSECNCLAPSNDPACHDQCFDTFHISLSLCLSLCFFLLWLGAKCIDYCFALVEGCQVIM